MRLLADSQIGQRFMGGAHSIGVCTASFEKKGILRTPYEIRICAFNLISPPKNFLLFKLEYRIVML